LTTKENKNPYGEYPEYFLADTTEEAEQIFLEYQALLNGLSYTYSVSTGIEKGELFGEAVMGLAKALKNFDESLGYTFKTYAVRVIKDQLNTFSRKNSYTVAAPAYIKRAHSHINKLKKVLGQQELNETQINAIIHQGDFGSHDLPTNFVDDCENIKNLIDREAERAHVSYEALLNRSEYIPEDVDLTDETIAAKYKSKEDERRLEIALFVEKLKEYMTETELSVCEGIMNDLTYEQIGEQHGNTAPWVRQILNKLKRKLQRRLSDGTITL
jgi:RNA polymerase sigma factor (sigma-70 family)